MSEHEHTPPIRCVKIYRLSPSQVNIVVRGVEIVLNREEVQDMIQAMERAFDEGPRVVCEVVR